MSIFWASSGHRDENDRDMAALCLSLAGVAFMAPASPLVSAPQRAMGASMQFGGFGGGSNKLSLPSGWKRVPSNSRPGQFSYLEVKTGKRYDKLPPSAGGGIYDDEVDTTYNKCDAPSQAPVPVSLGCRPHL